MKSYIAHESNGYVQKDVRVFVDKRLKKAPHAQCGVILNSNGVQFLSYSTLVIRIDKTGWLECTGTYSTTTAHQIGKFLAEYVPALSYHDVKRLYEREEMYNIFTGEVLSYNIKSLLGEHASEAGNCLLHKMAEYVEEMKGGDS